jgi:hypothetical protein
LRAPFLNMPRILHILTRAENPLAQELIFRQKGVAENRVETVDLTLPAPDYKDLLEKIFAADSVESW